MSNGHATTTYSALDKLLLDKYYTFYHCRYIYQGLAIYSSWGCTLVIDARHVIRITNHEVSFHWHTHGKTEQSAELGHTAGKINFPAVIYVHDFIVKCTKEFQNGWQIQFNIAEKEYYKIYLQTCLFWNLLLYFQVMPTWK